ncbi:MOSC domain-containing protein [Hyphomicrobium sp. LHD-15]|uniref:MOSC domain-containing protein n=1 Tax=Hyphomicrobium sp. LHD-15 TaxID=3072142 RepID=UPI00280D2EB3|nr:MOSC domain-containing protein [Hyphomicrobium sp. LHD-15]MDQ8698844.1 MOSC domain-containing protein [Hyphomicrobium sp. LHD-15]
MPGLVTGLFRYPVKGLSAEPLSRVALRAGETFPFDRVWAIENGPSRFDPADPKPVPDISFLILMRDERLAAIEARFEEETQRLTLLRGGRQVASGILSSQSGRQIIEQFFAAFMAESLRGRPKIVSAPGHTFIETGDKVAHIVNLATVRELERVAERPIDPMRFRPNIIVDGIEPWAEFDWIGKEISIGPISFHVLEKAARCAATNVDPKTGARDMDIPATLRRKWGHIDFGVYVKIASDGELSLGDALTPP